MTDCATTPPLARVINWLPVADVASACRLHHGVAMPGGCVINWNEAEASIVSATNVNTSDLGAMLRFALKGKP